MNNIILQKFAEYNKIAIESVQGLEKEISRLQEVQKQAEEKDQNFDSSLKQAAEALYDTDFITTDLEKESFVKKAKEDKNYLAKVIEKVCNASDVASVGSTARVAASKYAEHDPIMNRAFGIASGNDLLDL